MKKVGVVTMLVVMVALSFWSGKHFGGSSSPASAAHGQRTILYYIDPMTPGFRSDEPGIAPCGMPLEPVYAEQGEDGGAELSPGAVKVRADRQQLIGVRSAPVKPQPLTYTLRLYGKVFADETRVYRTNASTDSWVRELSDVTTGSYVQKGQVFAEVLAPAFYNAQLTYLITLDNMDRIKEQLGGEVRHQQTDLASNQIRVSVQAMQNLGITDEQIEELANTRKATPYMQIRSPTRGFVLGRNITLNQWFKAGEEFYTIADLSKVWVYSDVYEDEARYLKPGMQVMVKHAQLGKTFEATVSQVLPLFDPISKTLKVRLDIDNPHYDLRPDMFVDVEIPITMPASMYVSADALIETGTMSILYVDMGDGVFEPRRVETGRVLGRWVEITGGLMAGEKVVVSGNFLIDSESRMKTAAAVSANKTSRDPVCGMDVSEQAAESAEHTMHYDGHTYYFCSQDCKVKFVADMGSYVAKTDGKPQIHDAEESTAKTKDPVCGMIVDELKSEYAGLFVKLDNEPYHFCSPDCMKFFFKDPRAYQRKHETHKPAPQMKVMENAGSHKNPGEKLTAISPGIKNDNEEHRWDVPSSGEMQKRSKYGEPYDWDSYRGDKNDNSPKEWKGWRKFPGSEYLGSNDKKVATHKKPNDTQASSPANSKVEQEMHQHATGDQGTQAVQ